MPDELVYVARSVENTLVLPWGIFVEHWDAFAGSYGPLNVVDDNPGWYLMFCEEVLVYGCTREYMADKNMPEDVREASEYNFGSTYGSIYWGREIEMQANVSLYREFLDKKHN